MGWGWVDWWEEGGRSRRGVAHDELTDCGRIEGWAAGSMVWMEADVAHGVEVDRIEVGDEGIDECETRDGCERQ